MPTPEFVVATDAAVDLPPSCKVTNIIPVAINTPTESWLYPTEITLPQLLERLTPDAKFTSSAASLENYGVIYDALDDQKVLSVHTGSHTSGVVNVARTKSAEYKGRVRIYDTLNGSVAAGMIVERADQASKEGLSVQDTVDVLDLLRDRVIAIAVPDDDLTYLVNSKRAKGVTAMIAETLHVRPIIKLTKGYIGKFEQVRYKKTADRVSELLTELHEKKGVKQLFAITSGNTTLMEEVINRLTQTDFPIPIIRTSLNPAVIVNCGPNTIGFGAETELPVHDIF